MLWNYFHQYLLPEYAAARNGVNIVSGPVFDYDSDGLYDTPEKVKRWEPFTFSSCDAFLGWSDDPKQIHKCKAKK